MTPVILLLVSIVISFVVVRVGAVALDLTGIPWNEAKFQALSAFTNSGFTTRESEQITRHPVRRRIASILIVLGNAGLVAVVGSFAGSMLTTTQPLQPLINLTVILAGIGVLVWIGRGRWVGRRLRRAAREWLERRYQISEWSPNDLLHLDEGFALTRFVVAAGSPPVGKQLASLRLKDHAVQILAIERDGEFRPVPRGTDRVRTGDRLVVFGRAAAIEHLFEPEDAAELEVVSTDEPIDAAEAT
jgi:hypothetical protein